MVVVAGVQILIVALVFFNRVQGLQVFVLVHALKIRPETFNAVSQLLIDEIEVERLGVEAVWVLWLQPLQHVTVLGVLRLG